MRLAESAEGRATTKHKQDNWMYKNTKDLIVKGKEMDLLSTYVKTRQGEATLALGWAKAAASASSQGWGKGGGKDGGGGSFLTAEKELSKQIDTLLTNTQRIPGEKLQQRKATGAAFMLHNHGVPVAEMANVSLNYSELQDRAVSQAEADVADSPQWAEVNQDTPAYRAAVKEQTRAIMKPAHEVIDDKTYYINEGNYYQVPPRFISGNRRTTTYTDIMTQVQAQLEDDPALQRMAGPQLLPVYRVVRSHLLPLK